MVLERRSIVMAIALLTVGAAMYMYWRKQWRKQKAPQAGGVYTKDAKWYTKDGCDALGGTFAKRRFIDSTLYGECTYPDEKGPGSYSYDNRMKGDFGSVCTKVDNMLGIYTC